MDFANRTNRQTQQQPQEKAPVHTPHTSAKKGSKLSVTNLSHMFMVFATALLALAMVLGLVFITNDDENDDDKAKESVLIQADKYQAVFLDSQDGQVYFGKLGIYNNELYALTDVYYVRVQTPIQPADNQQQQANISLAKLGSELHCPMDLMYIARDKVLYWENLEDKGRVVSAITDYKNSGEEVECNPNLGQGGAPTTQQVPASGTQPTGTPQLDDTSGNNADQ